MEIFDRRVDWAIAVVPVAIAVYLFYGISAGVLAGCLAAAIIFLKKLDSILPVKNKRIIFSAGIILIISPIFRVFFENDFCENAPYAINSFIGMLEPRNAFESSFMGSVAGRMVEYCHSNLWSHLEANGGQGYIRDLAYPIIGLALAVLGWRGSRANMHEDT